MDDKIKRHSLLGVKDSRKFKVYREEFPAIFRFNGTLFQEFYNMDEDEMLWVEITPSHAEGWIK